ncbi:MAG: PocR ligand-binding domain-containing protein [Chloroflexi bacterium]|nr:PocR ligand-binding domain-containing protein [Chloroflexota bacterium]
MAEMLTAKEMQTLLQVDRSTIYRMADQVNGWLKTQAPVPMPASQPKNDTSKSDLAALLPQDCVQLIQNTFAEMLRVMLVITAMDGQPVTEVSYPCGLFKAISQNPDALQKCIAGWRDLGQAIDIEPKFRPTHLGLLCARSVVRLGTELKGMVIAGGVAPNNWPPAPEQAQTIAAEFGLKAEALTPHLSEVYYLDEDEQTRVLSFMQRIADIVAHIINERHTFMDKLETIAKLTR